MELQSGAQIVAYLGYQSMIYSYTGSQDFQMLGLLLKFGYA